MRMKRLTRGNQVVRGALAFVAASLMCWNAGIANAQAPQASPQGLSPDLQEVVTLSREHMSDEVITSYIKNSGKSYKLSADDIIYLNTQGVSQHVISTLLETAPPSAPAVAQYPAPAPGPAPMPTAPPMPAPSAPMAGPAPGPDSGPDAGAAPQEPPQADVNYDYFHTQLAPFGAWVQVPSYGWCWRPDAAIAANPNWRPYYDMGRWVYTDNGWFWQSDYTWGDIPFHYGNWILQPGYGWLWVPGYTWGPSWVFWRQAEADNCIGWAPLPPGAVFVDGGWVYHGGVHVGVDFDFGLGADFFVFVGCDHFHDGFFRMRGHEYIYHVPHERIRAFYGRTVIHNDFRRDEHGRLVNDGIGRERMERVTGHRDVPQHFEERNPVGDRDRLSAQRSSEHREVDSKGGKPAGETEHQASHERATEPVSKVYRPPMQRGGSGNSGGQQRQGQKNNK